MSIYVFLGFVLFLNAIVFPSGDGVPLFNQENNEPGIYRRCKWIGPSGTGTDQWCDVNCNHVPPFCPPNFCRCWPYE